MNVHYTSCPKKYPLLNLLLLGETGTSIHNFSTQYHNNPNFWKQLPFHIQSLSYLLSLQFFIVAGTSLGIAVRGLMRGVGSPKVTSWAFRLVVKTKKEDSQVTVGWASLGSVNTFSSLLWYCWLGDKKGVLPVKMFRWWYVGGDDLTGTTSYSCSCHHHLHLPSSVRNAPSLMTFRRDLKTVLFGRRSIFMRRS